MKELNFLLQRYSDNGNSTQGILFEKLEAKPKFFSHSLEDEYRELKLSGETRIPAGKYELKIRKEDTVLTIKHRTTYGSWFKYHIEIVGIKNFSGVYIHSGVSEKHTDGCLLLMDTMNNNQIDALEESRSLQAIKRFYEKVYPHLDGGGKAFLEIRDEQSIAA
jgi:hypothetical protein